MSSATGGLRELHQVHLDLEACHKKLESGPRQIAVFEKRLAAKQAEIDAQKAQITDQQKAADQKNLQFRTNEQTVADTKAKLNQAKSNVEFDIFKGQITKAEKANESIETEYLELLEVVDAEKSRLVELNGELKAAEAKLQKTKAEFAELEPKVKAQAATLTEELSEAEKCLPTKEMGLYRRLVGAHGASTLAPLDASACSECFVELSPQNIVEVRTGKLVFCKSCGRILYSAEAE
ncbi:MAG: putative nucleic acid-binding Zn-ribbon protein [Planctomycetaceae bacterium]|jgi:predicted  nucleic acid-binding Zn-ribbon protein